MAKGKAFPLKVLIEGVDRLTQPVRNIVARARRVAAPLRALNNRFRTMARAAGAERLAGAMRNVGTATWGVARSVGRLATRFLALGTLGAGVLGRLTQLYARGGDAIGKFTRQMQIGVEWYQATAFAADRLGIEKSELDTSIKGLTQRLGQMRAGQGRLNTLLSRVNPQLRRQVLTARDNEEAFELMISAIRDLEDPQRRMALATSAFGDAGAKMVLMAAESADGLEALRRRAHELGEVMSEEDVAAAEAFTDSMRDLRGSLLGVRNVVGREVLPIFRELAERATGWIVENREQIQAWVRTFAAELPGRLRDARDAFLAFVDRIRPFLDLVGRLAGNSRALKIGLALVAGVIAKSLIVSVVALTKAVAALGIALLATPIGWITLGIAALVAGAVWLWRNWDRVRETWARWRGVLMATPLAPVIAGVEGLVELGRWVASHWGTIAAHFRRWAEALSAIPLGTVLPGIGSLVDLGRALVRHWDRVAETFRRVRDSVSGMSDAVPDWVKRGVGIAAGAVVPGGGGLAGWGRARGESPFQQPREETLGAAAGARVQRSDAHVRVEFDNLPPGTRVRRHGGNAPLDMDLGYAMAGAL